MEPLPIESESLIMKVVFTILCHFYKILQKEMTHET
jgi:hypothetical protein